MNSTEPVLTGSFPCRYADGVHRGSIRIEPCEVYISMYKIMAETSFSAAHQLVKHPGKCRALHGHNWRVQAIVGAETLDDQGMVVDFSVLKKALGELCDRFDHLMVNEVSPFDRIPPTAENFAKLFFDELVIRVGTNRVQVIAVRVWETERNVAEYSI